LVEAFSASAGEPGSIPLVGTNDEMVNEPAVGDGIESDRRGRRVGPRYILMEGDDCVAEDEVIVGTTEYMYGFENARMSAQD
jgi:hypothetical protein